MKKITLTFIIVFTTLTYTFGQTQEATTNTGKKIILNDNGTWVYAPVKTDTIKSTIINVDTTEYTQNLLLGGCWFVPHDAFVNMKFYEDFTFKFHTLKLDKDYNPILLTGTYKIIGHDVLLTFKDGTTEKFFIDKKSINECYIKSYPIAKPEYYLVHSEDWVHPNLE